MRELSVATAPASLGLTCPTWTLADYSSAPPSSSPSFPHIVAQCFTLKETLPELDFLEKPSVDSISPK